MNCIRKKFNTNVRFTFLYFGKIYDFNFKIKIHNLKVMIGAEEDSLQFFLLSEMSRFTVRSGARCEEHDVATQ